MPAQLFRNRRANDTEIEDDKVKEMVNFLRKRLSKEDFQTLKKMVGVGEEEMGEDKARKPIAADSALRDYASRFPMAARIGIV